MTDKRYVVLYHGNCYDGFGAALAAWLNFRDYASYVEVFHGKPLDVASLVGKEVYFVDFCPPKKDLLAVCALAKTVAVIDHHKSVEGDLEDMEHPYNFSIHLDTSHSGAYLTYVYLNDDKGRLPVPDLFLYIEDRDLWRWELPNSREVSTALASIPKTFESWSKYLHRVGDLAEAGKHMLTYQQSLLKQMSVQAVPGSDILPSGDRMDFLVVNASVLFSDVCNYLLENNHGVNAVLYYFDRADGRRQWGSRARPGMDMIPLAGKYGGGGHHTAAGWTSNIGWLPKAD